MKRLFFPVLFFPFLIPTDKPDRSASQPGIDISSYLSCFLAIPDKGAECSLTLYDDLPVDDDPGFIFDLKTGRTGHCFLRLCKKNEGKSAQQYIGFTASRGYAIFGLPIAGKIVDNSGHKFNASLEMKISSGDLENAMGVIRSMGNSPIYSLLHFNCVSYALCVLNRIRPDNPILPAPLKGVNFGENYLLPRELYLSLAKLKTKKSPENEQIKIGMALNAGIGSGPCP